MGRFCYQFLSVSGVKKFLFLAAILVAFTTAGTAMAQPQWPQEISHQEATIVVYQPEPEKLEGNLLSGRAAISIEPTIGGPPIFGAMWFTARLFNEDGDDVITVKDFTVTKVTWPDSKDLGEQKFKYGVEAAVPESGFEISKQRLAASLKNAEVVRESLEQIKNDPPVILFRDELAVLLVFDGDPIFSDIENSDYERAVNTPFGVARNKKNGQCYMSSGKFWYQANNPLGPGRPPTTHRQISWRWFLRQRKKIRVRTLHR